MIKIFRTMDGEIQHVNEAQEGCWIALINPTATEILDISRRQLFNKLVEYELK